MSEEKPFKTEQTPYAKMTEDEIKEAVCKIVNDMQELRETCIERNNMIAEQIDEIDTQLYWLKRHFCPDKFETVQVPLNFLQNMIEIAYGENTGEFMKMERPDDLTT